MDQNDKKPEQKKNSKRFLLIYSIALFVFAGILIGLSYLSQARVSADTNKIREELEELTEKTEVSVGVQTRLEQVSAKNDDLEKANQALTDENNTLKKENEELKAQSKRADASEYLWQLEKAYAEKNLGECKRLLSEINAKKLKESLSTAALTEINRIEALINKA